MVPNHKLSLHPLMAISVCSVLPDATVKSDCGSMHLLSDDFRLTFMIEYHFKLWHNHSDFVVIHSLSSNSFLSHRVAVIICRGKIDLALNVLFTILSTKEYSGKIIIVIFRVWKLPYDNTHRIQICPSLILTLV